MPDAPTPLDLDALAAAEAEAKHYRAQRDEWFLMESGAREAAEAEVILLRTRIRKARHQRDEARAEAAVARQHQREASLAIRYVEGLRQERDDALAESDQTITRQRDRLRAREEQVRRLRAEVTRLHALVADLRATAAPAWDEEAARGALVDAHLASVRQVMEDGYPSIFVRSNEDAADAALAAHLDLTDPEGEPT